MPSSASEMLQDYPRGLATSLAPTWRDLAKADSKPMPECLSQESSPNLGGEQIPPERYLSYDFHLREVEKVWKRSWQVVCREEEIPQIGDHFVYNIAELSFLVVRNTATTFKAYYNVCLHRGRRLVDDSGCEAQLFRCRYHAWSWNIHGELQWYPGAWDFPNVNPQQYALREVSLDLWGGFIFINPDPKATPLSQHLGSLPQHFSSWPLEQRFTLWHVQKTIACNWKVAMEAFLEAYHVVQTHPQALSSVAEHATQYDIFDEAPAYFSRLITPTGVPSRHARNASALGAIADVWAILNGLRQDQADQLPADIKDRASLAAWRRQILGELTQADYSTLSDAEMLDSIQYWLFPNFCPWFGEGLPLSYQFRPNADSAETCYMDVWMLVRAPDAAAKPPAARMIKLAQDEPFEPVIGAMGLIFDQDDFNMPKVQLGLKTWPGDPQGCTLARYQESRIRFFHQVLMKTLNGG